MKIFTGKVISTKMAKTAVVEMETFIVHPTYKKRLKKVRKFHVHDEIGANLNDIVKFTASRPYSKLKRWKILKIMDIKKEVKHKERKEKKEK